MQQLNVLVLDIETAPMIVYAWGRRDITIGLNQIKKDWHLLAFAAKKLGAPPSKMVYHDQKQTQPIENDKPLLQKLWKLLDTADVVLTHNGKKFDARKINARFILNGMNPPSPYKHFDTLVLAREVGDFTSASLEYLTDKLCVKYKKLKHKKYPGQDLWTACLDGKADAWVEMKKYNTHDVLSLEEMYFKIRAWAPKNSAPFYVAEGSELICKRCGNNTFRKKGFHYYARTKTRRLMCKKCKAWREGNKETL